MSGAQSANDIRDMLLDAAGLSLDRLPMLHVIFDRMSTTCRAPAPYGSVAHVLLAQRARERSHHRDSGDVRSERRCRNFPCPRMGQSYPDRVRSRLHLYDGGGALRPDGSEPPVEEARGFSNIELRMAQTLFEQVAKALQASFSLIVDTKFKLERIETRMDFAVIGRPEQSGCRSKISPPGSKPRWRDVRHHSTIGSQPDAESPFSSRDG